MADPKGPLRPSLLDRLLPDGEAAAPFAGLLRDLEDLINTRADRDIPPAYPAVRKSVVGYGLPDFGAIEAISAARQVALCRAVADAIARHEPRLRRPRVTWVPPAGRGDGPAIAVEAELADGGRLAVTAEHAGGRFRVRAAG